ncbi:DnaJ domain-containing protein [Rhodoferax sp. OV413]|nr:DnaJ domain-containing protein [Rhodoferax sp. OV413]
MNYYELLEVSPNASKEVLRAAYKSLMQRHHPDKHQADSAMASRAALIVQAYGVLSDAGQRAAYDVQLKQTAVRSALPAGYAAPRPRRTAAPATTSNWYLWLLAIVILAAGGLMWSLSSKKKPAPPVATAVLVTGAPALPDKLPSTEPAKTGPAAEVRKLSLLGSELRVVLATTEPLADGVESSRHILSIPAVTVEIGNIESEKFASLLTQHQDELIQKLSEKLAYAPYAELRIEGDKFLNRFIADALRDITVTQGLGDKASAGSLDPNRYGVVAVSLPASFALR